MIDKTIKEAQLKQPVPLTKMYAVILNVYIYFLFIQNWATKTDKLKINIKTQKLKNNKTKQTKKLRKITKTVLNCTNTPGHEKSYWIMSIKFRLDDYTNKK